MAVKNQLAAKQEKTTFSAWISNEKRRASLNAILGKNAQQTTTAIVSAVSNNPGLAECSYDSILACALLGAGLNLSPSPQLGQFYMVPFNDRKTGVKKAVFVLGYKGYIQLAIRSGYYKKINVLAIKEGELKSFDPLNEEIEVELIQDDEQREQTPTIGYYAMFEYHNGFRKAMYWSKSKMEAHADKYSSAFSIESFRKLQAGKIPQSDMWKYSSYWYSDFDGMAYKTMLRQLISKWGIMSIELQRAFESDEAAISEDGKAEYIDASFADSETPTIAVEEPEALPEYPDSGTSKNAKQGVRDTFFDSPES
jgi:recombination protein RecT